MKFQFVGSNWVGLKRLLGKIIIVQYLTNPLGLKIRGIYKDDGNMYI